MMETMAAQRRRIAQVVAALGPRGRTSRVPDAVRAEVVAYARTRRADGASWRAIADEIGFSVTAVQGWGRRARGTLVPVSMRAEPIVVDHPPLVVITPSGLRVEGLDVGAAVALVRALA